MPDSLQLDRRAELLAVLGGGGDGDSGDDLLNTSQLAIWLGVSTAWCEIARHRGGYGPPFVKIGNRVRYRRADVIKWLVERARCCTSEYRRRGPRPKPVSEPEPQPERPRMIRRAPLPTPKR